ncbi:hypothetical protein D516_3902 [Rhodobacter sp. AKP1]|nr:Hypothetical Protein RSKD131_1001 [Cereibacter sphaeroides KD131]EKX59179.1 hypothetical protein D516_3902 [Rhodobacter sp. AKP1]
MPTPRLGPIEPSGTGTSYSPACKRHNPHKCDITELRHPPASR